MSLLPIVKVGAPILREKAEAVTRFDKKLEKTLKAMAESMYSDTVKKWMNICKGFLVNNLGNSKGTDANKIFIAKAAYGMAETKAVEQEQITGAKKSIEQIAADIGADPKALPGDADTDDPVDLF